MGAPGWCFHSKRVGAWHGDGWLKTPVWYQAVKEGEELQFWENSSFKVWFDLEWKQTQHCLHHRTPRSKTFCLGSNYLFGFTSGF